MWMATLDQCILGIVKHVRHVQRLRHVRPPNLVSEGFVIGWGLGRVQCHGRGRVESSMRVYIGMTKSLSIMCTDMILGGCCQYSMSFKKIWFKVIRDYSRSNSSA